MRQGRNAYWVGGTAAAMMLALLVLTTGFPAPAGAFWPFPNTTSNTAAQGAMLAYSGSTTLLRAPTTPDPTATATDGVTIAMTGGAALIAADSPGGVATDASPTSNGQISLYVVRPGDSLSEIAQMFGVSVNTILWANNIRNASLIKPGDTLLILPVSGIQHTVTNGETLATIAKKYHANTNDIALYNGIDAQTPLTTGEIIVIPGGEMPASSVSSRASVSRGSRASALAPNPYRGGGGPALPGFFSDPLPGGIITQRLHGWNAFDIGARTGTPIHAAAAGTVIVSRVGGWNGGYGNYVVIDHGNGTQTLYAHMSRDISHVGEQVSQEQVIGYVGRTGEATGPHLHFEVRGAENPFAACRLMEVDTGCFMQ
ncbi:MAG: hypothetical protein B7X04_02635 [Parcubacteria group bacterium 21-54-25]|nr:MAG: hypothetical protein B7X04_02635 [Parcubacteria group bacterium 21-54-25]